MIDNYDSFTFNLVHYFQSLQCDVEVVRNDAITVDQIEQLAPTHIVISPGPGTPNEAGISLDVVTHFSGKVPIFGVCLGHQTIAQAFGAAIIRADKVMHGKTSMITHNAEGLFNGITNPLEVVRYHSLLVEPGSLPPEFIVTARSGDDIMALQHKHWPVFGVQFHPESILSQQGHALLNNFLQSRSCE